MGSIRALEKEKDRPRAPERELKAHHESQRASLVGLRDSFRGTGVFQLVNKHLTLGFALGHDLRSSPMSGFALTAWRLLGILSPSLSLCPSPALSVSLSK